MSKTIKNSFFLSHFTKDNTGLFRYIHPPYLLLFMVFMGHTAVGLAQIDSLINPDEILPTDQLEDFLESTEEAELDFNTLFENLEFYLKNPLNLNKADEIGLEELGILSNTQIIDFLNYRQQYGELISIYELQAVPSFDLLTIQKISPFVSVENKENQFNASINEMLTTGDNDLFLRWSRVLEEQRGFREDKYLGDRNSLFFRYRHNHYNRLTFGFTAEKDIGEEFFKGSNSSGFDFYSAHIFLKDYNRKLKSLAIGDFQANFGQGLILYTGFARGKTSYVHNIKRVSRPLKAYTSANEVNFMRGIGATYQVLPKLEMTLFASSKKRDGNIIIDEIEDDIILISQFSSLQTSNLHRTEGEIADEKSIRQNSYGTRFEWKEKRFSIAFNGLYNDLSLPFQRIGRLDNQFSFSGDKLLNLSTDYSIMFRNLNIFGETAWSDNGAIATINGLLVSLNPKVDFSLVQRSFPRDFHYLDTRPFSDRRKPENENGTYLALTIRPMKNWILSGFYDIWTYPWLRFGADGPGRGDEWRGRLTYFQKRKLETYLEFRQKTRSENLPNNETPSDILFDNQKFQTRLNLAFRVTDYLEWRSRVDFIRAKTRLGEREKGFMMYQDLIFRKRGFPLSMTARYAFFDTDSFDSGSFNYENDVIYFFSIPAYFNRGNRYYLNLRYKGIRNMTIEGRIAQTYYSDGTTPSSALDEIDGNKRTEVRLQIIYSFGS